MRLTPIRSYIFLLLLLSPYLLDAQSRAKQLKVGIIPFKSDEKVLNTFGPIMDAIGRDVDKKAEIRLVEGTDLAYYLSKGTYDIGIFTVFPYLREKHDFPELEVFATHQIDGADAFYGSILCNKDENIEDLNDLKGGKLLFVKPTSTSGFKYPKGILAEYDLDIEADAEYDFSGGHVESIVALKNKTCKAIAIDETRFAKVDSIEKSDFHELDRYKVPYHAYVLSPELDQELQDKIKEAFKSAHRNPDNRELWDNPLGIEKFIPKKDDYYNSLRRYLRIIRVKPSFDIKLSTSERAKERLDSHGDILSIITQKTRRLISESNRFSTAPSDNPVYEILIDISQAGDNYSQHIYINDEPVADGDISEEALGSELPLIVTESLLEKATINTELLTNGDKWFITYGLKDGLNHQDYVFEFMNDDNEKVILNGNDIIELNEMNIQFKSHPSFEAGTLMNISYSKEAHALQVAKSGRIFNIFRKEFWRQDFMDMSFALLGTFFGISVFLYTTLYGKKRKKHFKNILYQTNNLIKKFVEGHYEMETKLLDQKENIRTSLEKGHINENQFLILNHRLEELENLINYRNTGDIPLCDEEVSEITDIIQDKVITEKEYTRIMKILKTKRKE